MILLYFASENKRVQHMFDEVTDKNESTIDKYVEKNLESILKSANIVVKTWRSELPNRRHKKVPHLCWVDTITEKRKIFLTDFE